HEQSTKVEISEPADVMVTETMGMFGLDEAIVGAVLDARNRLLRPGAAVIPQRIALSIVPVEDAAYYAEHIGWWSEAHFGIDFSSLRLFASSVVLPKSSDAATFLAPPAPVIDVDLATVEAPNVFGEISFLAD